MPRRRRRSSSLAILSLPFRIVTATGRTVVWLSRFHAGRVLIFLVAGAVLDLVLVRVLAGTIETEAAHAAFVALYAAGVLTFLGGALALRQRRRLRTRTFGELLALTPRQFEQAVGSLLHDLGYRDVRQVGGAGDLAADLKCKDRKGRSVVVQCKRHAPGISVGSRDMQAFIGMIAIHHQAERGIFVTTSNFTQPAAELAKRHGIDLIDGGQLSRLVVGSSGGRVSATELD
jgi:restriction system protein